MKVGIPKALLYYRYYPFFETFFTELGAEIVTSENTNKRILDEGVKYCTDEACLPVKIFHGHIASIKDKCDVLLIPRIMSIRKRESICPKFCGLPEMVISNIPNLPKTITYPIYAENKKKLYTWATNAGHFVTRSNMKIKSALNYAVNKQHEFRGGLKDAGYKINVALVGHPYNIYDSFINMNLVEKLNKLDIGVITEENMEEDKINEEVSKLFKRPFWSFARNYYGFSVYLALNKKIDGIIYLSSFECGIDSVVIELIKNKIDSFPMLILKIDEQTGEAGFDTRIEAFSDMLKRRCG